MDTDSQIAKMNAILFLTVFAGTLAAVWVYPALCSQRSACGVGHPRRWLRWVPLANLCLRRPMAQNSGNALLSLALAVPALLARIWVDWLQTINGRTQCRLDTRWAFVVLLLLSAATLAWTLWRRWLNRWGNAVTMRTVC